MNKSLVLLFLVLVLLISGCTSQDAPVVTTMSTTSSTTSTASTTSTTEQATTTTQTTTTSMSTTSTSTSTSTTTVSAPVEPKVEIIFFHPTYQCETCKKVSGMVDKVIYSDYSRELASGQLTYEKLSLGDPKAKADIVKYGALASSLWIGTTVNGTLYKETKLGVWTRADDEEGMREYLGGCVDKRLEGDLSN